MLFRFHIVTVGANCTSNHEPPDLICQQQLPQNVFDTLGNRRCYFRCDASLSTLTSMPVNVWEWRPGRTAKNPGFWIVLLPKGNLTIPPLYKNSKAPKIPIVFPEKDWGSIDIPRWGSPSPWNSWNFRHETWCFDLPNFEVPKGFQNVSSIPCPSKPNRCSSPRVAFACGRAFMTLEFFHDSVKHPKIEASNLQPRHSKRAAGFAPWIQFGVDPHSKYIAVHKINPNKNILAVLSVLGGWWGFYLGVLMIFHKNILSLCCPSSEAVAPEPGPEEESHLTTGANPPTTLLFFPSEQQQ